MSRNNGKSRIFVPPMKTARKIILFILACSLSNQSPNAHQTNVRIKSGLSCSPFNFYGFQHCIAGIESMILDIRASDTQHASQWCWAASIEGIFNYYGHFVPQEEIVKQTWGSIVNQPGQPEQILQALNRTWTDANGDEFEVKSQLINQDFAIVAQELAADHPLIVGSLGHAMILTALEYDVDIYSRGNVTNAIVRDPWPYNNRRRALTPKEWYSISFLAVIQIN